MILHLWQCNSIHPALSVIRFMEQASDFSYQNKKTCHLGSNCFSTCHIPSINGIWAGSSTLTSLTRDLSQCSHSDFEVAYMFPLQIPALEGATSTTQISFKTIHVLILIRAQLWKVFQPTFSGFRTLNVTRSFKYRLINRKGVELVCLVLSSKIFLPKGFIFGS